MRLRHSEVVHPCYGIFWWKLEKRMKARWLWLECSSPSVAEQEGYCVISHSTALTSSINSSQILITCFQDVALPLWPITLCWAPNCQRKAKVRGPCSGSTRAYTFCTVPTVALLVCRRKDNQMWLKNLCIIASPGVKEFVPVFSPWLHMEHIISWHLTLTCVINSVNKLSASFTSCALDYNLGSLKVKCSSQEFLLMEGWMDG